MNDDMEIRTVIAIHNQTIDRILKFIADWEDDVGEFPNCEVLNAYLKGLKI